MTDYNVKGNIGDFRNCKSIYVCIDE